eukprot:5621515-Pyramimonas_sp.AAC.1
MPREGRSRARWHREQTARAAYLGKVLAVNGRGHNNFGKARGGELHANTCVDKLTERGAGELNARVSSFQRWFSVHKLERGGCMAG